MKLFARRVAVVHFGVVLLSVILAGVLNYIIWSYVPADLPFATLETVLLPFARPLASFLSVLLILSLAFDRHTMRVMRKLSYFKSAPVPDTEKN